MFNCNVRPRVNSILTASFAPLVSAFRSRRWTGGGEKKERKAKTTTEDKAVFFSFLAESFGGWRAELSWGRQPVSPDHSREQWPCKDPQVPFRVWKEPLEGAQFISLSLSLSILFMRSLLCASLRMVLEAADRNVASEKRQFSCEIKIRHCEILTTRQYKQISNFVESPGNNFSSVENQS